MENSRTAYRLKESSPVVLVHCPVNTRPIFSYYYYFTVLLILLRTDVKPDLDFLVPVVGNAEDALQTL